MATIDGKEITEKIIDGREGTVYITNEYAYKVFIQRPKAEKSAAGKPFVETIIKADKRQQKVIRLDKAFSDYTMAAEANIPIPHTEKLPGVKIVDREREQLVGALKMDLVTGHYFQFSVSGESDIMKMIYAITSVETINWLIPVLREAGRIGLADPQGFIAPGRSPPIMFIDIHLFRRFTPIYDDSINAARNRLAQLEARPA